MKYLFLLVCVFASTLSFCQAPTDNPYKTRYGTIGHWTDSLKWSNIYTVTDYQIYPNDFVFDDSAVIRLMDTINLKGGGVMYFPAGVYDFSNDLRVKTGVIIRGDNPSVLDATDSNYLPPTRFEFPKYIFDTLANGGAGVSNSTAFKSILPFNGKVCNAAVVNIDVNRAGIAFGPSTGSKPGFSTPQPLDTNFNILVFGTRTNNVASASPYVPASFQKPWQRHSNLFSRNIRLFVFKNGVIANNRCNDLSYYGTDDSFEMPNYTIKKYPFTGYEDLPGEKAIFSYTDHYGILINRKEAVTAATPEQEPSLFAEGLEVLDNWLFITMRVGISVSGLNTEVRGNVIRNKINKVTWLHPLGQETPKNANTFENRGIDISGWGVRVINNDIEVQKHRINSGPFYSVDGEGILFQSCCGGTTVNGYKVSGNRTNGSFISIFYSNDIHNVEISNNDLGGPLKRGAQSGGFIWVTADVNASILGSLSNTYVNNNYNIDNNSDAACFMIGSKGGYNAEFNNNTVEPVLSRPNVPLSLQLSCHVKHSGNSAALVPQIKNNGGLPCQESTTIPEPVWLTPSIDTTFCDSISSLNVVLKVKRTDPSFTFVDIYSGNTAIATNLSPSWDSTVTFSMPIQPNNGFLSISAIAKSSGFTAISPTIRILKNCAVQLVNTGINRINIFEPLLVIPNPASDHVKINSSNEELYFITDASGKQIEVGNLNSSGIINVKHLNEGFYLIRLASGKSGRFIKRTD